MERSVAFYSSVLGMEPVTFAGGRRALAFGVQKINLHEHGREIDPKAARPTPGSADLCLLTAGPLGAVLDALAAAGVAIEEGRWPGPGRAGRSRRSTSAIPTATCSRSRPTSGDAATMRAMPRVVNLTDPELYYDPEDPDRFRSGLFRPGRDLGAEETGASLYELPPGQSVCPYHYEYAEEEWALVLQGRPTLRTPEGESELGPLDLAFFPKGPDGAHQIRNDSDEAVRIVMWSNIVNPSATAYPDSGKVGIWTGVEGENVLVERSSAVPYFHGEV